MRPMRSGSGRPKAGDVDARQQARQARRIEALVAGGEHQRGAGGRPATTTPKHTSRRAQTRASSSAQAPAIAVASVRPCARSEACSRASVVGSRSTRRWPAPAAGRRGSGSASRHGSIGAARRPRQNARAAVRSRRSSHATYRRNAIGDLVSQDMGVTILTSSRHERCIVFGEMWTSSGPRVRSQISSARRRGLALDRTHVVVASAGALPRALAALRRRILGTRVPRRRIGLCRHRLARAGLLARRLRRSRRVHRRRPLRVRRARLADRGPSGASNIRPVTMPGIVIRMGQIFALQHVEPMNLRHGCNGPGSSRSASS